MTYPVNIDATVIGLLFCLQYGLLPNTRIGSYNVPIQNFTNATLDNEQAVDPKYFIFELRTSRLKPSGSRGDVRDRGVFWLVALHFCECQAIRI